MPRLALTAKLIPTLRPGEYWDTTLANFGVRLRPHRRVYMIRVRERGRRIRLVLGTTADLSLADARLAAVAKLQQHDKGEILRPPFPELAAAVAAAAVDPASLTVSQLCDLFLADHATTWSDGHRGNSVFFATRIVIPQWGTRPAASLTRREIRALELTYAKRAPVNANRLHAFLSRLFRWAVREELVDRTPLLALNKPTRERGRDRLLTAEEIRQFWAALDRLAADPKTLRRDRVFTDIWRLRLLTAQREQSLRRMEWSWIHFQDRLLEIPADAMKGKQQAHLVPLAPRALAILEARRDVASKLDKFVFGTRDAMSEAPGRTRGVPLALPNFRGHDLRRTATTLMTQHGVSRFEVARVLNHRDPTITGIYDRYEYVAEKRRALETLDRAVTAILDPAAAPSTVLPFTRS